MCGICGVVDLAPAAGAAERETVRAMAASLSHRGPDDEGFFFSDPGVALGHRRLSIVDLSGGHQPLSNEDHTVWVVYNGEIYNHAFLRADLEKTGHRFRTRSDTEVLVHGYEREGTAFFRRLNGIFALALWNAPRRRLVLARDPFGVKPLYFRADGPRVSFASELRALRLDGRFSPRLDPHALDAFLAFRYVPGPRTLLAGVSKLLPGHALTADADGARIEPFTDPPDPPGPAGSERGWTDETDRRLAEAVQGQMMSDVPVGALLSGGVDSALVAALMRDRAGERVRTFTVGFEEGGDSDETAEARATARLLGTDHHEVRLSAEEYRREMPRALGRLEEPIGSSSALAVYFVCREAARHVKVVLTGQGADELFAGYDRYRGEYYGGLLRSLPAWLKRGVLPWAAAKAGRSEKLSRAVRSLDEPDVLKRFLKIYSVFPAGFRDRLYRSELRAAVEGFDPGQAVEERRAPVAGRDGLSQMTYVDVRLSLPDDILLCADKMSMAASVELRVPFLDPAFVRYAETIPSEWKIRRGRGKYLLKRVAERHLPGRIVYRRKRGFATPVDRWFRKELRGEVQSLLEDPAGWTHRWFRPEAVRTLLEEHAAGREDHHRALFALWSLELWAREFL